jgi:hypothetical protein
MRRNTLCLKGKSGVLQPLKKRGGNSEKPTSRKNFLIFNCMKKIIVLSFIILFSNYSFSQSQSARYKELRGLLISEGYSISTEQYADLKQGGTAGYTKTFYEGTSYVIVAISDDSDVSDVDVYLRYTDGTEYSKDTDSESLAILKFNPTYTREMRVVIKNYASRTPNYASRCRFIIAYK